MLPNFGQLETLQLQSTLFCKTPEEPRHPQSQSQCQTPCSILICSSGAQGWYTKGCPALGSLSLWGACLWGQSFHHLPTTSSLSWDLGPTAISPQMVVQGLCLWGSSEPEAACTPGPVTTPAHMSVCCSQSERRGVVWDIQLAWSHSFLWPTTGKACRQAQDPVSESWLLTRQAKQGKKSHKSLHPPVKSLDQKSYAQHKHPVSPPIYRLESAILVCLYSVSTPPPALMIISTVHMCCDILSPCILHASFLWLCHELSPPLGPAIWLYVPWNKLSVTCN